MISTEALSLSLAGALGLEHGATITALHPLSGGDSQPALRCQLGGRDWFVKFTGRSDRAML